MLTLEGLTQSNARVTSFIRALENSGWMARPDLSVIEAKGGDRNMPYIFNLKVNLVQPKDENAEAEATGGGQ